MFAKIISGSSWKHAINSGLLLIYRLSSSVVGFIIFALSLRKYGPELLGKYAYALTVCQIIAPLLLGGIDPMLVRELIRRPADRLDLLGSAFLLVLLTTLAAVGLPILFVALTDYHDKILVYMVLGLSVSLIPNCILVLMSFFRAEARVTTATICGLAGVVASAAARILAVLLGAPLYWVTAATVIDPLVAGFMLLAAYGSSFGSVFNWKISGSSMNHLFQLSWSAVLSSFVVTLFFRLSHLMLKSLGSFDQLAYYAIGFQMFAVLNFLPSSILTAVFPRLVLLHKENAQKYGDAIRKLYVAATIGGMIIIVLVWLFISPVLELAFGPKSRQIAPVAVVMAIANLFTFSGAVRSLVIYIEHKPIYHVYNAVLGLVALIPLNFWLIPKLGASGAAISVAIACFICAVVSSWITPELRSTGLDQILAFGGMRRRIANAARSTT